MSRRRVNALANQIREQFINAPPQIRIDFLRKNDEALETESNDFIQTLASFQQELGQITSVFDSNSNNKSINQSARASGASDVADSETKDLEEMLKFMANKYATPKVVVNPEITQKVQAAESAAIAKYLQQLEFQKRISEGNAALKTYARPATQATANSSAIRQPPPAARTRWPFMDDPADMGAASDSEEIAVELKGIKEEIMGRLINHDRLIESGRERLQKRLNERRRAALATNEDTKRTCVQAILSRQKEFEQNVDKTKMEMQRKLKSRIEQRIQNRAEASPTIGTNTGCCIFALTFGENLNGMVDDSESGACLGCTSASTSEGSDILPSTSAEQLQSATTESINNLEVVLRIPDVEERTDVNDVYDSSNRIFTTFFMVKFKQTAGEATVYAHADARVVLSPDVKSVPGSTSVAPASASDHDYYGDKIAFPVDSAIMNGGCSERDMFDESMQHQELSKIERQVVDRLISLGDTIEQHCGEEIDKLLTSLRVIQSPTETLRKIAELIFKEAQLNWGRILVFFYFVVRFFLRYAAEHLAKGLINLASIVVDALKEICTVRIFQWIADHGGWRRLTPLGGAIARAESIKPFLFSFTFLIFALGTAFFLVRARARALF
ncbi:Apoptosi regulator BAX [Taenia crassiceps]|uniref:Apoptosi regulator BAX n=1 Tax=Taenia crassiceps TaxID=6207 RepID=A0ABR4Q9W9_9CEST